MENSENGNNDVKKTKTSVGTQEKVKKLKIKRFRRKDGEKKQKRDPSQPKHPLTGYIRYMNVRREELKKIHPESTAIDITKIIGEEWNRLSDELKKPYLDAAELDKERYHKEYAIYEANKSLERSTPEITERPSKKTKTNGVTTKHEKKPEKAKLEIPEKADKKSDIKSAEKRTDKSVIASEPPPKLPRNGDYDIPIFTEEFLDYNKKADTELRLLRRSNIDIEQKNSVLEKHVESIRNGISKMEDETSALKQNNEVLETYIYKLRKKLTTALSGLSLPTESEPCNIENVDKYMCALQSMASNSHGAMVNKVKDIVRKLDLQI